MMAKIRYTGLAPAETGHFSHHGKVGEASSTGMIVSVVTLEYGGESIYEVLGTHLFSTNLGYCAEDMT